jgi:hypothetical protein
MSDNIQQPRDPDAVDTATIGDRTQEIVPEDTDVLADPNHDDQTAAEAAEQADPGVTAADQGA